MKKKILLWILNTFYKNDSVGWNILIDDKMGIYTRDTTILGKRKVMLKGSTIQFSDSAFDEKYTELVKKYGDF
jgi:hypothetical protein